MKHIWIIGGGQFGMHATQELHRKSPESTITVVDEDSDVCRRMEKAYSKTVCMDGIAYLYNNLKDKNFPDWIVPAIPVHVAYEWVKSKVSAQYHLESRAVPDDLVKLLPNPLKGDHGELYVSNADFICPDTCAEPEEICTYTGEQRPSIVHAVLESIRYNDFCSVVVRSRQLLPGVGGYAPEALFKALLKITTTTVPVLLSTACRCHGVMHAFTISEQK